MKRHRIDPNTFTNCLRVQIIPDEMAEERITDVRDFCLAYSFGNVMLFFNAEEFNRGHITREEAEPWIRVLKHAKEVLEEAGISVSLNPWMEIEDDFRLHNHAPLNGGGCFCGEHMRRYNARLGTHKTRRQFVQRVFREGEPTQERIAWLDECRDTMLALAEKIGTAVAETAPGTRVV